jgi:hypothetical protein
MLHSFDPLGESRRRAMFVALVGFQDRGLSVAVSRAFVSARFDVSPADVVRMERDGLADHWPPLAPSRLPKAIRKAGKSTGTAGAPFAP